MVQHEDEIWYSFIEVTIFNVIFLKASNVTKVSDQYIHKKRQQLPTLLKYKIIIGNNVYRMWINAWNKS